MNKSLPYPDFKNCQVDIKVVDVNMYVNVDIESK